VNNFSISWKLVFVAASALALTAVVPLFTTAVAYADIFRPAIEIAPLERSADHPPAWTEDSIPSTQMDGQPQAAPARPRSLANMLVRHAAMPDDVDQERRLSPGSIIGLICAIAASSVALGIAFGLRRKIDRIAGSDPDKADDD
jgi:hypothetical protein